MTTTFYNKAFWHSLRGDNTLTSDLKEGYDPSGGYIVPSDFNDRYLKALAKENVFRRLATVVDTTSAEGRLFAVASLGQAKWLKEMEAIPESDDSFKRIGFESYKLGSLTKIKEGFIKDMNFNLEGYLENEFARRFGRSEEEAFISGSGVDEPTGILNPTQGGVVGLETKDKTSISYDDVIKLYFSLDKDHRKNAVWLMNDETALALRSLKDAAGNYLWRESDNTILGKPVEYSTYMPNIESGASPIAFGDFSHYWIIHRQPLTIMILRELYTINGEIGLTGYERLDGKLILPEAVKLLRIA